MIVVIKHTEERLLSELRKCRKETPNQPCFHLQLSAINMDKETQFTTVLKVLHHVEESYKAYVFFCQDRDAFILMRGLTPEDFALFVNTLGTALQVPKLAELARVYHIWDEWTALEKLCEQKRIVAEQVAAERASILQHRTAEVAAGEVLKELDDALVASLCERRRLHTKPMVMVVDDDQLSRTLASNVIAGPNFCTVAKNGKDALAKYVECAPDVLFLDIGLPDIDGYELLGHLFHIDPNAYVIMFSGRKEKENILKALEMGAQGFVGKPFTRACMLEYIAKSPFVIEKQEAA